MSSRAWRSFFFLTGLILGGCSAAGDKGWPSPPAAQAQPAAESPAPSETQAPSPIVGTASIAPVTVSEGASTGTFVGQKVGELRGELRTLNGKIAENDQRLQALRAQTLSAAQSYYATIAAISARLQVGTTPGNPQLQAQWNNAAASLDQLSANINQMSRLASDVAANSSTAGFILDSAKAVRGLSGAVDEDHRQLNVLEDETNRTVVQIDRLLSEITNDIQRQTAYVGTERSHLTTLASAIKAGQLYGGVLPLAVPLPNVSASALPPPGGQNAAAGAGRRPLVIIRFDRDDVRYREQLYSALSQALERKPEAMFDVVSIAPSAGSAAQVQLAQNRARQSGENVVRSMADMGMPAGRIHLTSTTSGDVSSNEVQVFIR